LAPRYCGSASPAIHSNAVCQRRRENASAGRSKNASQADIRRVAAFRQRHGTSLTIVQPVTSNGQRLSLSQLISNRAWYFRAIRSSQTYFLPLISTIAPSGRSGGQAMASRRPQMFAPDAAMHGVWSFAPARYCTRSHTSRRKYRVWEEGPVALALCRWEGLSRSEYSRFPRARGQREIPEFFHFPAPSSRHLAAFITVTCRV